MSNEISDKTKTTPTAPSQTSSVDDKEEALPRANRNDDSNPQQGGGKNIVVREGKSPAAENTQTPAPVWMHQHLRPSLKIPPTAKDERKLFVGGLPGNSK
jgi:hypothetical protein